MLTISIKKSFIELSTDEIIHANICAMFFFSSALLVIIANSWQINQHKHWIMVSLSACYCFRCLTHFIMTFTFRPCFILARAITFNFGLFLDWVSTFEYSFKRQARKIMQFTVDSCYLRPYNILAIKPPAK